MNIKKVKGYQTGDVVRAVVTSRTKQDAYVGRVLVQANGTGLTLSERTRDGYRESAIASACWPTAAMAMAT